MNMRQLFISFLLMVISTTAFAQSTGNEANNKNLRPNSELATQPQYPGGRDALIDFLSKNIKYPRLAEQYEAEGKAYMSFVVDTDGSIKDINAVKVDVTKMNMNKLSKLSRAKQKQMEEQFAKLFAQEAYRVIKAMPKWQPGMVEKNGEMKAVKTQFFLPITYNF